MSYKNALPMPHVDVLNAKYILDAENGILTRRKTYRKFKAGDPAGYNRDGYVYVKVDGKSYAAHRIIYFMVTREDPGTMMVDHINGDPLDNRFENLRLADIKQNGRNRSKNLPSNTSGHRGVWFNSKTKRWQVRVHVEGKNIQRVAASKDEAVMVANEIRRKHYGEFAGSAL